MLLLIRSLFLVAIASITIRTGRPWLQCGSDNNDGPSGDVCPDGNTCCRLPRVATAPPGAETAAATPLWGCISGNNNHPNEGECCQDDLTTGCRAGFTCTIDGHCVNVLPNHTDPHDGPLPPYLPRYRLGSAIQYPYQRSVHYLPSGAAFLSSHALSPDGLRDVEQLWIVVHGSGHNPDDYLCCAMSVAAASAAAGATTDKIWIMTPWFLPDGSLIPGLQWAERGPIDHTWRYGANAIDSNVSSYAVVDDLLNLGRTMTWSRLQPLQKIIVAGHSAGGQYVQRWALLTDAWSTTTAPPIMRAIVANPKSFCWLDERRIFFDEDDESFFRRPHADERDQCPTYNEWEWGTENSTGDHRGGLGPLDAPYKDTAVAAAVDGWSTIVARYRSRDVIYLAGELDVLQNGDCEDRLQGDYRLMRSDHFFQSLQLIYNDTTTMTHRRSVVKGVHHDHCLMFQSPEGRAAFFGATAIDDAAATLVK